MAKVGTGWSKRINLTGVSAPIGPALFRYIRNSSAGETPPLVLTGWGHEGLDDPPSSLTPCGVCHALSPVSQDPSYAHTSATTPHPPDDSLDVSVPSSR